MRCQGRCVCDVCCRRRGEVYIPLVDYKPLLPGVQRARTKLSPGPKLRSQANLPPLQFRDITGEQYWANIYDLDFGRRVGEAYVGDDMQEDVVLGRGFLFKKKKVKPKARMFIGDIQPAWGLGKKPRVKEKDPLPRPKTKAKGDSSTSSGASVRYYIGRKALLYLPTAVDEEEAEAEARASAPYEGGFHSMTYLDGYNSANSTEDGAGDEGEYNMWGSGGGVADVGVQGDNWPAEKDQDAAVSLNETDVAMAIEAGLRQIGQTVEVAI